VVRVAEGTSFIVAVYKQDMLTRKLKYLFLCILNSEILNNLIEALKFKIICSGNLATWQWHSASLHKIVLA
jgi:hypothetical protein